MTEFALGTQGWSYADWVGPMYELGARPQTYLGAYAEEFGTVEIDSTFYGAPAVERVRTWAAQVPEHFRFSCKLDRAITHKRRLRDSGAAIAAFYDVVRAFGPKLGCVLAQFDGTFTRDDEGALRAALDAFPRDVRTAFEFRDAAWYDAEIQALLEERGFAFALSDAPFVPRELFAALLSWTEADFAYVRWIGSRNAVERFDLVRLDRDDDVAWWVQTLRAIPSSVRTVYGYANNHYQGHSPATVRAFYEALGVVHQRPMPTQPSLFRSDDAERCVQ